MSKQLSFVSKGKGPVITFLHGFPEAKEIWTDYMGELSSDYLTLAIDLPGMGASDVFDEVHTMDFMAKMVHQVWQQLGVKSSAVVGHSMGGYVGLELLSQFPDMVDGLCLFQSTANADSEDKKAARLMAVEAAKADSVAFAQSNIEKLFAPGNKEHFPQQAIELAELASKTKVEGITAALLGMRERKDFTGLVNSTTKPVLYLLGENDPIMDAELVGQQGAQNDNVRTEVVSDMGHLGFIEQRDKCLELLTDWL